MIVAIDGPAASGKTTTARGVAQRLGFRHIDTGALYRAVTLHLLRQQTDISDPGAVERALHDMDLRVAFDDRGQQTFLGEENLGDLLRGVEVTAQVSAVSALKAVRSQLLPVQRKIAHSHDVVLEGRDIGTVVFPDADIKIFMIADLMERARRRKKDFAAKGIEKSLDELAAEIQARDEHNANRDLAPMKPAEDAITLDTSHLAIEEQIDLIVSMVVERRNNNGGK